MNIFSIVALVVLALIAAMVMLDQRFALSPDKLAQYRSEAEAQCTAREHELPSAPFATDACTLWPNGFFGREWTDVCIEHDVTYWCGGTDAERTEADAHVARDVDGLLGRLMHTGVRIGGHPCLPAPWRWGYGHPWPRGCGLFE